MSHCIYHFPIDFEPHKELCLVLNQSENGEYNRIWVNLSRIKSQFGCAVLRECTKVNNNNLVLTNRTLSKDVRQKQKSS